MNGSASKDLWERLNNSLLIRLLLLFACGWALLQVFAYFETVIVVFTFAAIIAFLLNYPVRWLKRYLPHSAAVILVFLLMLALLIALGVTVGITVLSQGQQLLDSLLEMANSLSPIITEWEQRLRDRNIQVNLNTFETQIRDWVVGSVSYGLGFLQQSLANLAGLILIAVVALFMLLDGQRLWHFMLKLVPRRLRDRFSRTVRQKFLGFFRGQLMLMAFLTTSSYLVFSLLQLPFALLLAFIVGVVDAIPGIGATLGVAIVVLILLTQGFWLALKALIASVILQQIQDNFMAPRVMQNALNVNPVIVFFALLVGVRVAGLLGVFLAVPIAAVLVSLLEIEEMQGESNS